MDSLGAYLITPEDFWPGDTLADRDLVVVDVRKGADLPCDTRLPPVPIIAIGESCGWADVVVPRSANAAALADNVLANPRAAAVIVQLLRMLPHIDLEQGLVAESFAFALLQGSAEHHRWVAARRAAAAGDAPDLSDPPAPGSVEITREDDVLTVLINRPWAGNAIDRPIRDGLVEAFDLAALDHSIRTVQLRGAGKAFSLGADLHEFGTTSDPATAHHIRQLTLPAAAAARCADRLDVQVQGACVGSGLELACYAKRLTASPRAWFQLPELAMGILPGAGGCVSLTHRIGRQKTAAMILSGHRLTARQALGWGFIDAIVEDDPASRDGGADAG